MECLGDVLGRLGGVFGVWRASWGRLGGVWGRLGGVLGASWSVLGRLGDVLGASWERLGASCGTVLNTKKASKSNQHFWAPKCWFDFESFFALRSVPNDVPRRFQDAPKMFPRRLKTLQDAPRRSQDDPKMLPDASRRFQDAPKTFSQRTIGFLTPPDAPKTHPRRTQDAHKTPNRARWPVRGRSPS